MTYRGFLHVWLMVADTLTLEMDDPAGAASSVEFPVAPPPTILENGRTMSNDFCREIGVRRWVFLYTFLLNRSGLAFCR